MCLNRSGYLVSVFLLSLVLTNAMAQQANKNVNQKLISQTSSVEFAASQTLPAKIHSLMTQARQAMMDKHYQLAIKLYTRVTRFPQTKYHAEAQEYLGLARERNGQLAHAKAEYEIYLKKYPQGKDADRVRQRLDALVTAFKKPREALKKQKRKQRTPEWQDYGIVMQFYNRDVVNTERFGDLDVASSLTSNLNYTTRLRNSDYRMKANVAATHVYDFLDSETDDQRITSMYYDLVTPGRDIDLRIGRQKGRSGGVIGRYDGVNVSYQLYPAYRLRVITGYPFERYKTVDHRKDKNFNSISIEVGPIVDRWDASIFFLEQVADNIVDRKEAGMEIRYRSSALSIFSLFDYSLEFDTTNYFMTVINGRINKDERLDLIIDYRKSPFLTTTSALQGQVGVSTLGDLLDVLTEQEIDQLSLDRTAVYKSLTAIYTRSLSKQLSINLDFSISNLSGTVASGGVAAFEGTDNEYSISAGVIAKSLLMKNDLNLFNLRNSRLANSDVLVLNLSSRYRLDKKWQINPAVRYDTRDYDDGRSIDKLKPYVRLKHRYDKRWQFEMDLNYETKNTHHPLTGSDKESSYSLYAGYIFSF
ncbi:MAG: hypothetical protein OQK76_06150 [Gammaproteobacteria bacterium]|nr:hypothetical protein [Gammaproteobacteria bacterium]MCW8910188.1 hypothetical protein [Gammaproteobacteria bacterium]MCW9004348.1 hypothetical protein [Gammaproteobacteria bacterium]